MSFQDCDFEHARRVQDEPVPETTISEALKWTDQAKIGQKAIFEVNSQGKIVEFWALGSTYDEVREKFASAAAAQALGRIVVAVIKPVPQ